MGAQEAVRENFQQFQVNENKAHIDQNMEEGRDRAAAHFGLTQRNAGHLAPAQCRMVGGGRTLPTEDIGPNALNTPHKGIKPCDKDRNEEQGLEQLKAH